MENMRTLFLKQKFIIIVNIKYGAVPRVNHV